MHVASRGAVRHVHGVRIVRGMVVWSVRLGCDVHKVLHDGTCGSRFVRFIVMHPAQAQEIKCTILPGMLAVDAGV